LIDQLLRPRLMGLGGSPPLRTLGNGPAFKAALLARHIASRPEFSHIRTPQRSPHTNGVIERFFGSVKREHFTAKRSRTVGRRRGGWGDTLG
jgi:transposase InsO family protein